MMVKEREKEVRAGGLLRAGMAQNSPPFSSGTFIISSSRLLVNHHVCLNPGVGGESKKTRPNVGTMIVGHFKV